MSRERREGAPCGKDSRMVERQERASGGERADKSFEWRVATYLAADGGGAHSFPPVAQRSGHGVSDDYQTVVHARHNVRELRR